MKHYGKRHIGKVFTTTISTGSYKVKVIEGGSKNGYVTIEFTHSIASNCEVMFTQLKKGNVKNPYHPSLFKVGFKGEGEYTFKKHKDIYNIWRSMLSRCYRSNQASAYINVTICKEWHNFQIFAKWATVNKVIEGVIDKDILQPTERSKVYSPNTCLVIPRKLNNFIEILQVNNTSGYPGVSLEKVTNSWCARVVTDSSYKHLGVFETKKEAFERYKKEKLAVLDNWIIQKRFNTQILNYTRKWLLLTFKEIENVNNKN